MRSARGLLSVTLFAFFVLQIGFFVLAPMSDALALRNTAIDDGKCDAIYKATSGDEEVRGTEQTSFRK